MAKRGEARPFTVRFRFDGQREWALGSFTTRDGAEFAARQQRERTGPAGETCRAWVVDRREPASLVDGDESERALDDDADAYLDRCRD